MIIVFILILVLPVFIWPGLINAFNMPKFVTLLAGACVLAMMCRKRINPKAEKIILLIVALNVFSLFYTLNPYQTKHAVVLNLACLMVLYFIAGHSTPKGNEWLMIGISVSGLIVAIVVILQGFGVYFLVPSEQRLIVGTIGNSNYLGAYLIFPFYSSLWLGLKNNQSLN